MSGTVLWVIVACVFAVGELLTKGFFLAALAVGAALAAISDAAGAGGIASWFVFVIVVLLSFGVVRPIARAQLKSPPRIRTGSAALVGKQAIVLERIANDEGVGCVTIGGEVWTARAFDEEQVIASGTRVHVVEIKGATALVIEWEGTSPAASRW